MQHTTSEVLDLAADMIQRHGWAKGPSAWADAYGDGLCLEGAIAAAMGVKVSPGGKGMAPVVHCAAYVAVEDFLDSALVDEGEAVPNRQPLWWWNDKVAETSEDVIAILRATAAVQRAYETEDQPLPIEVAA